MSGRILNICWYQHVSNREVQQITEQPPLTLIVQKRRLMLFATWQEWMSELMLREFLQQFLRVFGRTSSQLLAGHNEERPIISQPHCGRCRLDYTKCKCKHCMWLAQSWQTPTLCQSFHSFWPGRNFFTGVKPCAKKNAQFFTRMVKKNG